MKHLTSALEDALNHEPRLKPLSPREVAVMEYVLQGCTRQEIASALGIATGTVHFTLRSARAKLQVHRKGEQALIVAYLATRTSQKVVPQPNRHIMVIEHDAAMLEFMIRLLETNGYQVTSWRRSTHVIEQVVLYRPDLVLLDHHLGFPPDGWEILQMLRAQSTTAHIPVILYSAENNFIHSVRDEVRVMQCDVLEKPFEPEVLLAKIEALTLLSHER